MLKYFANLALDRLGIETNRSTTLRRFLATHPIDLVVDAGANIGQFARQIRSKGYEGRIWSFEPVTSVFRTLEVTATRDPNWKVSRLALGSRTEEKPLIVPTNHTLSSFLTPSDLMADYDAEGAASTEMVSVRLLDDILADDPATSIFLKMDVQGFEKEVLEGAKKTLERTHAIYIELPIEHIYEGGWTFVEAITYLDCAGFTPAQFRTVQPLHTDRASAIEFDCLLRRKAPGGSQSETDRLVH